MRVPISGRTLLFGRSPALYRINQYVVRVKPFLSEALLSHACLPGQWKLTPFLGLFQQAEPFLQRNQKFGMIAVLTEHLCDQTGISRCSRSIERILFLPGWIARPTTVSKTE